jgi:hypothetical protein
MKVKMVKSIQGGPWSMNGAKFLETSFFETLYIKIRQLVSITLEHFTYINSKGVCGKNLETKEIV